jgi:hypothetical protein
MLTAIIILPQAQAHLWGYDMNAKLARKIRKAIKKEARDFKSDIYRMPFWKRVKLAIKIIKGGQYAKRSGNR